MRAQIVALARSYVGTPYQHQCRLPGVALDCAGVPVCISRTLGFKPADFDIRGYPASPDGVSLKAYCDAHLVPVAHEAKQAGDVILVSWQNGPAQHLGILAGHPVYDGHLSMIHAIGPIQPAKVIETRLLFGRTMRLVAVYAFPGVD